jgi:hypothetical protein
LETPQLENVASTKFVLIPPLAAVRDHSSGPNENAEPSQDPPMKRSNETLYCVLGTKPVRESITISDVVFDFATPNPNLPSHVE